MNSLLNLPGNHAHLRLLGPVLAMILAGTALPIELRPLGSEPIDFSVGAFDVFANIFIYFALGLLLGPLRPTRAIAIGSLISISAEFGQLMMMHRAPSAVDVITNITGTVLGALLSRHWRHPVFMLRLSPTVGLLALAMAVGLLAHAKSLVGPHPSLRGLSQPGQLEAHWSMDEAFGNQLQDSSGQDLSARIYGAATRVAGAAGNGHALHLDGIKDWARAPRVEALRLDGSMTICAWFRSSAYPKDDAALVSTLGEDGFQLDTTIDLGPRTLGFKLSDPCDNLMIRYGATELRLDTWYHAAGVYDAQSGTLDLYLNGKIDNGSQTGRVAHAQKSSRDAVQIGRRGSDAKFAFAGDIDDIQIYSAALNDQGVAASMRGSLTNLHGFLREKAVGSIRSSPAPADNTTPSKPSNKCPMTRHDDAGLPGLAGMLGVAIAMAGLGLRPTYPSGLWLGVALGAGSVLVRIHGPELPAFNHWLLPLTCVATSCVVIVSRITKLKS